MLSRILSRKSTSISNIASKQSQLLSKRWFADGEMNIDKDAIKPKQLPQPPEGEMPEFFKFTLSTPHKELFTEAPVRACGIPGAVGRFAVTPGHIPIICEMQSGILSVYHEKTETAGRQDHYFVAGGMCLVHPDATLEISASECVLMSDIDPKNIKDGLSKAQEKRQKATEEKEQMQADIEIEAYEQIERALQAPQM